MTLSSLRPPVLVGSLDAAFTIVRSEGLRLSAARRSVLKALFAADGPVTADELASATELELTSVYRNLETFEQLGLVQHVHLGHGAGRYALAGERDFVLCEVCGEARTIAPSELDGVRAAVRAATGLAPRFSHFPIVGVCAACQAKEEPCTYPTAS